MDDADSLLKTDDYSIGGSDVDEIPEFSFDWDNWRRLQHELETIYERQRLKGGIIDVEEEKNRNLVTEDTVRVYLILHISFFFSST